MRWSRREVLFSAGALATLPAAAATPSGGDRLVSLTAHLQPIALDERRARIAKLQGLMQEQKIRALLVEPGSSLDYFTGVRWHRSERTTAAIIPARGDVVVVTPVFEEPSVRETLQVGGDVRTWNEDESPFALLADVLRRTAAGHGPLAIEETTRFFIVDGVRRSTGGLEVISGASLVRACRMVKSPAELALLQAANDVTLAALRQVHSQVQTGMTAADIGALMASATLALGGGGEGSLILLNEASAYPHGSVKPQSVHEGSILLLDCGCSVHGYESDISRTWVHGEPTARQRRIWETVRRGQQLALETAKPGVPVGAIDDAVRAFYVREGFGPAYHLPGLSHRTGHGIGMDGHESPYLVHGDATALATGMCFSDEPGLYIPGEFGVRLEDCWHMTETGPKLFTGLAASLEQPI
jgi:Xaa-Pro dipeptidase